MNGKRFKVLIVDDEKTNVDVLVGLLSDGFKTVVAKNGEQALKRARTTPPPDMVLLDVLMPDMDGFEVCRQLKEDSATAGIPVIFITVKDNAWDETRGLEVGAVDFIRKPFNPSVVLARIQTHLAFQEQKKRLVELNALKNSFLGMAAHDLRNPLVSICGLSSMLLDTDVDKSSQRELLSTINDVGQQMLTLINNLLDVSIIESGELKLNVKSGDLARLAATRIEMMKCVVEKKGSTIKAELRETDLTRYDEGRIAQVMDNLLSNALKFSPSKSEITVRTGRDGGRVFFQVIDQGPGISKEEQGQLFVPFKRLSGVPTGNEGSTGLGLSIVKQLVDAHRGEVRIDSEPGEGATFSVLLPVVAEI